MFIKIYFWSISDGSHLLVGEMEGMNVKVVENRKVAISLCRSAHPGVNVTLKKKHQGRGRLFPRELVAYDPRLGFVITKVTKYFDGFFICEARYGKLTVDKDIRLLFLGNYHRCCYLHVH